MKNVKLFLVRHSDTELRNEEVNIEKKINEWLSCNSTKNIIDIKISDNSKYIVIMIVYEV